MAYKGQPFQKGIPERIARNHRPKRGRSRVGERLLCKSRGQRYGTEGAATAALAYLERTKINPGALKVFACRHCGGYHLGTAFGPRPRKAKPEVA